MRQITQEDIQFILSIATLLGILFTVFKSWRKPAIDAEKQIAEINSRCIYRREAIDKDISGINTKLKMIEENHIRHIEASVKALEEGQIKILTILEEREKARSK